jgi:phospholipid transport system substrate-binding protein
MEVALVPGRQHIWSRLIKGLCRALVLVFVLPGTVSAAQDARAVVEALHVALLESMRNAAQLGYQGRYRLLEPVLRKSYDFPFMTKVAIGRSWSDISPSDQARLTDLFAEMSIANYAARFNGYTGERFEVLGQGPGPRDTVIVQTRLVRPKDAPVELNYVMREFPDGWRIIDVLLEAKYSELARQHAEFAAVLNGGGVPELIAMLEKKIKGLAGQT